MMFGLLHHAARIAVLGAAHSFHYAAPFMAVLAAVSGLYLHGEILSPTAAALLALAALLLFGMPYVIAVLHTMLRGETPPFARVLRWRRRDFDFLAFVAASFIFIGMLGALVASIGMTMYDYAAVLEADSAPREKYGYGESFAIIALFGSKTLAAGFFIVSLFLWSRFYRAAIRIPAYIDGYDLSNEETLVLTRHYRLQILATSLLLNVGLLGAAALSPWRDSELWLRAAMAGFGAWSVLHANLALSVAMYRKYAEGYNMRPMRSF